MSERASRLIFHDDQTSICIDMCRGRLILTSVDRADEHEVQVSIGAEGEAKLRAALIERADQAGEA